jgi:hypothetical protein
MAGISAPRLLAARDDLTTPFLFSKTRAQREGELTQLNGKLYTVAKAQFDKLVPGCGEWAGGLGFAVALSSHGFTPFVIGERVPRTISRPPRLYRRDP